MSQKYYGLVTDTGIRKLRDAAGGGAALRLTHLAFGDGGGAETAPAAAATSLVNERYRSPVSSLRPHDTNPNVLYIEGMIPAGVGGWTLREAGVYDNDGDLIVIARPPTIDIALIAEGASVEGLVRLPLVLERLDSVTVLVDPSVLLATQEWVMSRRVPIAQLAAPPFVPVISATLADPPAARVAGDLYAVPADPSGEWAGHAHALAEWDGGKWRFTVLPVAHVVGAADTGLYWRRTAGGREPWRATVEAEGLTRLASVTDTRAGARNDVAVTPDGLHDVLPSPAALLFYGSL